MKKGQKGFTLVEMLCTVVILLLVSASVTMGIRLAVQNFAVSITRSESQTLCSAVIDGVSDEYRYCTVKDWDTLAFQSSRYRGIRTLSVDDSGQVMVVPQDKVDEDGTALKEEKLLPTKTYPNGLRVSLDVTGNKPRGMVTVKVQVLNAKGSVLMERTREVEVLNANLYPH